MKNQRYLAQDDAAILYQLAEQLMRLNGLETETAEELSDIVASATRLSANSRRKDVVMLDSTVSCLALSTQQTSQLTLVHPSHSDPGAGRISVLTPIGMAILGRKINATIEVALPSGKREKIQILDVKPADVEHAWDGMT